MDKPLFSIIVPLYNKEDYILEAINSVLSQSVSDFELIVVDDGSTDRSAEIVASLQDSRVHMIRQQNAGVSAARNHGISEAMGKYVCFLDADDFWMPDFLQTVQSLFHKYPQASMACPSYQVIYGSRTVHPKWRSVPLHGDGLVEDFFEMATAPFWVCHSSCMAVERSRLMQMEHWFPEGETVYEDLDFQLRLGSKCVTAHSNRVCAAYRRFTQQNARKGHAGRVVYSAAYMATIVGLLSDQTRTAQQRKWLWEIRDRRMVPYIFSLLLVGQRKQAVEKLKAWHQTARYSKYKLGLGFACCMPRWVLAAVQKIRLRVF